MTFEEPDEKQMIFVELPRRSLLLVDGEARTRFNHGIFSHHITERRIVLTMREASEEFQEGGVHYEQFGKELRLRGAIRL